jgi:hypothetical protein
MTQAEKLLEVARGELGYLEKRSNAQLDDKTTNAGSANYTKYWAALKPSFQGQPWCAAFCVWCARQAGAGGDILPAIFSCSQFIAWFKGREQWLERSMIAKPGDLVFFGDASGKPAHVGLVYKVDSKIYTYEGNASSAAGVTPNGGAVVAKSYANNYARILGYGRPKYAADKPETAKEEDDTVTQDQFEAMYKTMAAKWAMLGASDTLAPEDFKAAKAAGLTDGSRPQSLATRQEVAVMAYRAALR